MALRAIEVASGAAIAVRELGSDTDTLEISIATAGASIERSPRIAEPIDLLGELGNRCASSAWIESANRWLASACGCGGSGDRNGSPELIVVSASCSHRARRGNMEADEERIAISIRDGRAVVIRGIGVVVARHHHAIALPLKLAAHGPRKFQHHVFFDGSTFTARAGVRATVSRVQHNHGTIVGRRLRSGRRKRSRLRSFLLRGGLRLDACGERCAQDKRANTRYEYYRQPRK
jgi:hypothetical protein